jgi:hypothetical protein
MPTPVRKVEDYFWLFLFAVLSLSILHFAFYILYWFGNVIFLALLIRLVKESNWVCRAGNPSSSECLD